MPVYIPPAPSFRAIQASASLEASAPKPSEKTMSSTRGFVFAFTANRGLNVGKYRRNVPRKRRQLARMRVSS